MSKISKEEIVEEIRRVDKIVEGVPSCNEIREHASMSYWTINQRFGGVVEARKQAGLEGEVGDLRINHPDASELDFIRDVRRVGNIVGRPPSYFDIKDHSKYELGSIIHCFGGMPEVREAAGYPAKYNHHGDRDVSNVEVVCEGCGVKQTVWASRSDSYKYCSNECMGKHKRKYTTERIRKELFGLARSMGQAPTVKEFTQASGIGHGVFEMREDLDSFSTEVREMGFKPKCPKDLSDGQLLEDLRRVSEMVGRSARVSDLREHGHLNDPNAYVTRWGSWYNALNAAGVSPENTQRLDIPKQELIEEYQRVADQLGRAPSETDVHELASFCPGTFSRAFGSFIDAKLAAGFQHRRADYQPSGEDHYAWGGGLDRPYDRNWLKKRKQALARDKRQCVRCGKTSKQQRRESGKDLHVHHITPWREFDDPEERNRLKNLVTLCASCHRKIEVLPITPEFESALD